MPTIPTIFRTYQQSFYLGDIRADSNYSVVTPALAGKHSHWRLYITNNSGSSYTAVTEVVFFDTNGAPVDTLNAERIASGWYSWGIPENAFDGSLSTYWYNNDLGSLGYEWIGLRFRDEPVEIIAAEITLNSTYTYWPTQARLQFSDDGINWTDATSSQDLVFDATVGPVYHSVWGAIGVSYINESLEEIACSSYGTSIDTGVTDIISLPAVECHASSDFGTCEIPVDLDAVGETSELVGVGEVELDAPTVSGEGQTTTYAAGELSLPRIECFGSVPTAGAVELPAVTVEADGHAGATGAGAVFLPRLSTDVDGETEQTGTLGRSLPIMSVDAVCLNGGVATATSIAARVALAAAGYTGSVSTGAVRLPLLALDASSASDNLATAVVSLPLLSLHAITKIVEQATTGGFSLNLGNGALTEYELGVNSVAQLGDVVLVATDAGVFALSGVDDNGAPISHKVTLPLSNLGTTMLKRIISAHIGQQASGDTQLNVRTDDGEWYSYVMKNTGNVGRGNNRVKLGRGISGTYFDIGIEDVGGGDNHINSITLEVMPLTRSMK